MTTDRETAEWVARTYLADAHPTVAALAAAYLRAQRLADRWEHGALRWADPLPVPPEVGLLREALDLTRRGCPSCGALIPNDMARCALCGWPMTAPDVPMSPNKGHDTEVTP